MSDFFSRFFFVASTVSLHMAALRRSKRMDEWIRVKEWMNDAIRGVVKKYIFFFGRVERGDGRGE